MGIKLGTSCTEDCTLTNSANPSSLQSRVLSRIYRLEEKSQVAEGHERPSGGLGHAPPEIF